MRAFLVAIALIAASSLPVAAHGWHGGDGGWHGGGWGWHGGWGVPLPVPAPYYYTPARERTCWVDRHGYRRCEWVTPE